MIIMAIKTILFLVLIAHVRSVSSKGEESFVIEEKRPTQQTLTEALNSTLSNFTLIQKELNTSLHISDQAVEFLKGPLVTRFMPSFYIIIILISLPLNALALVTFTCRIREKKPAVIYMSHLACVDLLFALLLPLKIHYQLNASDWLFGEAACRVLTAAYYCYMYCSILLMMCMSVDRLLGVALPIASLTWRSTRKASCVCVLVWLLALAGTVPLLSMRQTFLIKNVGMTCHDALEQDSTEQVYLYLFFILSCLYFFVPLVITLVSYSTIIYVLSVKSDRISSSSSNRNRAVIMTASVLTEFVVCFGPTNGILLYHCIRLATGIKGEGNSSYASYMLAVCLGSASVFLDPLLYYYGSSHYRKIIKSVLRRKKQKKQPHVTQLLLKTSPAVTCET
ncbi:proteinase-activated receptor 1-like [Danio rerio]|uniref:Proteinase-activated receptor 1 n=1 Tax=Danio rerio TaxID=7955 RepID=E7FB63_DANRE|nr:proteinase-activated receptor 1-like [Danio rerio]|eukprot:XP_001334308.2 proteinase-activated receptor 1-like [Danio rerio]